MLILSSALLSTLGSMFRSRAALELEHLALRHQIGVLKRSACPASTISARRRPKLTATDRLFWGFFSRVWCGWRSALDIVKPATANRLASPGISPFLDLEDPAWPGGSARRFLRGPRSDPQDES
jgi:hypothetical protein